MYRVFEALDELVTIVEEARGVPMTSGCVVSRGDVLELLDDIRDAIPRELDDAQDVLDHRDLMLSKTQHETESELDAARTEADRALAEARAEADRLLADAQAHAEHLVTEARNEADRTIQAGRHEYQELVGKAQDEADRLLQTGRASYERAVDEGQTEQARLVAQTEVVQVAHQESARIMDAATGEADRLRNECDAYVDSKLAEFEELLIHTSRTVSKGRASLRGAMVSATPGPFDYRA